MMYMTPKQFERAHDKARKKMGASATRRGPAKVAALEQAQALDTHDQIDEIGEAQPLEEWLKENGFA